MDRMTDQERTRFTQCYASVGDCWLWLRMTDRDGYGVYSFRRLNRRAHRVSYWASVGDIPAGYVIDHICDHRACVRPEHLRCLSARENTLRGSGVGAVNAQKTHCPQGHILDRRYRNQRYCSICERAKQRRLKKRWRAENTVRC